MAGWRGECPHRTMESSPRHPRTHFLTSNVWMLTLWSLLGEDCSQLQVASYAVLGWEGAGTKVGGAAGSPLGTGTPSASRAVRRVGKASLAGARQGPAGSRRCASVLIPRFGSRTGEPSAASKRTRCIKVGAGAGRGGGAARRPAGRWEQRAGLTPPVLPRRRYSGHRQPPGRLQGGTLREHGRPEDAFPTGSSCFCCCFSSFLSNRTVPAPPRRLPPPLK